MLPQKINNFSLSGSSSNRIRMENCRSMEDIMRLKGELSQREHEKAILKPLNLQQPKCKLQLEGC